MGAINNLRLIIASCCLMLCQIVCTAQQTPGPKDPCIERVRFRFKIGSDTVLVRRDLHDTKRKGNAFGAIHALGYKTNRSGLYPLDRIDLPENRISTTDTAFRRRSDHMLSGAFEFFYRNGTLMREYVFSKGYIVSLKTYRRDGSLAEWFDYDFDYDGCLFTFHVQMCHREKGREWTSESVYTSIDKKLRLYEMGFALAAKRRGWVSK
jgi:hypothetical protein